MFPTQMVLSCRQRLGTVCFCRSCCISKLVDTQPIAYCGLHYCQIINTQANIVYIVYILSFYNCSQNSLRREGLLTGLLYLTVRTGCCRRLQRKNNLWKICGRACVSICSYSMSRQHHAFTNFASISMLMLEL